MTFHGSSKEGWDGVDESRIGDGDFKELKPKRTDTGDQHEASTFTCIRPYQNRGR